MNIGDTVTVNGTGSEFDGTIGVIISIYNFDTVDHITVLFSDGSTDLFIRDELK